MNQAKIGKFIAACRKEQGLTQAQLAEAVGVSDRAVSKWETGRSLPDSSIMLEVCEAIGTNVNELLNGERITMDNYREKAEAQLLEMKKQEEQNTRRLLRMEVVIGWVSSVTLFVLIFAAALAVTSTPWRVIMIAAGSVLFGIGMYHCLRIEREAGYYECKNCGYKYVPAMSAVVLAPHMGRSRYMKCPHCGRKNYHKKILTRD